MLGGNDTWKSGMIGGSYGVICGKYCDWMKCVFIEMNESPGGCICLEYEGWIEWWWDVCVDVWVWQCVYMLMVIFENFKQGWCSWLWCGLYMAEVRWLVSHVIPICVWCWWQVWQWWIWIWNHLVMFCIWVKYQKRWL